jgi:thiol-disulfide isomerase/thioredoxin
MCSIAAAGAAAAKSEIKVQVRGLANTSLILGYRFEDKHYIADTAITDPSGSATFTAAAPWHKGIYFIALPNKKTFDFLLSDNQELSMTTDTIDLTGNLRFRMSPANDQLAAYQRYIQDQRKRSETIAQQEKTDPQNSAKYNAELNSIDFEVSQYIETAIANSKDPFLTDILKLLRPINNMLPMPSIPSSDPNYEAAWRKYYDDLRMVYFNNVNFNEPGLIFTPFFKPCIDYFFKSLILQYPDTITKYMDMVIAKALINKEMYRYMVEMFFLTYQQSEIMVHDAVVVYIADKYYFSGAAFWGDSAYIARIRERIDQMRPTLIGNIAPSLQLQSIDGDFVALDTIKARFTIICFFEPGCSHCQKEVPKLWTLYQKVRQHGVKVYAVYTQYDRAEWEKFVRQDHHFDWFNVWDGFEGKDEKGGSSTFSIGSKFRELYDVYSTPSIFLLDENKRIIAKRMGMEVLENILKEELKINDK